MSLWFIGWSVFIFNFFSNPTPDGVPLLDGIPKFFPYNTVDEYYTAIDDIWRTESDYTLTYTVTVDELNNSAVQTRQLNSIMRADIGRFQHSLPSKNNYLVI
jgi:hypothetical protein